MGQPERIALRGDPHARGIQYGQQARAKIERCIAAYRAVFLHRAQLEWEPALRHARTFQKTIGEFSPAALEEMNGIAEGAGVPFDHILALNCRSELMFAARRRVPDECTSFAVLPEASGNRHMLLGQNWDWVPFAQEVCVLVEARREDGPSYATVVEAGMLAKIGFNEAGLGLCTNTLVSTLDGDVPGVPYHVMLRALLDATSVAEGEKILCSAERALSANYLLADSSGAAANFECAPGGAAQVHITRPEYGVLTHANHFTGEAMRACDYYVGLNPHSITRLESMQRALQATRISVERIKGVLCSHDNPPNGVCSHPDPKASHPLSARSTIASVILDLTAGDAWLTAGPPCESRYEKFRL
jgi:isopenicillin-N N-acyltransferase-like protein